MVHALGPYDLTSELGAGGAGRVFRATHRPTGAQRAVKVLASTDPEMLERFRREVTTLASLGGEGVVTVHEFGVQGGHVWYAMDLMPGGSLASRLKERGTYPWREAATLVRAIAKALERGHARGLVHRDLKPDEHPLR